MNISTIVKAAFIALLVLSCGLATQAQTKRKVNVLAYYANNPAKLDSFDVKQMTHIIFCFGHLDGSNFKLKNQTDTAVIRKMVSLKKKNPELKVLLSLGGWGGCETCSDVFATEEGRQNFAKSVLEHMKYFKADGIDLDWEYPAVEGYPGHKFTPEDKVNFTKLVEALRTTLGKKAVLTFAAGGFQKFLDEAVEWEKVMAQVDFVNLMSYDLINGYSTQTGHHTALYSTPKQSESTDNAVKFLINKGIDPGKIIIGAAFYARVWENVPANDNGLYQPGKFKTAFSYKDFPKELTKEKSFSYYWDEVAKAPYMYSPTLQLFATFDDKRSIEIKTQYVIDNKLGGIMFWELAQDTYKNGLLQTINTIKRKDSK